MADKHAQQPDGGDAGNGEQGSTEQGSTRTASPGGAGAAAAGTGYTASVPPSDDDTGKSGRGSRRAPGPDLKAVVGRVAGIVASIARWLGLIFAAILVLHVVFTIGQANAANGIVSFVRNWAEALSLGFKDLFTPADANLKVLLNFGIAAVFWLIVGSLVAAIIRRLFARAS